MRIKKVSQTTPTQAQIVDGYSTSATDGYSANYINDLLTPVTLWEGTFNSDSASSIQLNNLKNNYKTIRIKYRGDWALSERYLDIPVVSGRQAIFLDLIYGWSGTTIQIRQSVLYIADDGTVNWDTNRVMYRNVTTSAVSGGVITGGTAIIAVTGIYGLKY